MSFRLAARADANQAQIVRELRALGFRVDIVHRLKKLYDLVVTGRTGGLGSGAVKTLRVEIKMPGEDLTPDEKEYWRAEPFLETLIIAEDTETILKWFDRLRPTSDK